MAPRRESRSILRIIKKSAKKKGFQQIVEFAHEFGGIAYATKKAEHYSALEPLPYSSAKEALTTGLA